MKTFSTFILATLAVAAFAAESADAVNVHNRPVVKKVAVAKQHPAKILAAADLNEGDDLPPALPAGEPWGDTLSFDETDSPATKGPLFSSNSGSGDDGSNEDGSADGSTDGSNEDSSADGSGDDEDADGSNSSGSGVNDPPRPVAYKILSVDDGKHDWELFDHQSSNDGSGGSQDDDEDSSSSGSGAEETEGSGSNGSGSGETAHHESWGDLQGKGLTRQQRHQQKQAGLKLAAENEKNVWSISLSSAQAVAGIGAAVGAAVGTLVVVLGVVHLRRQQQRDEQSTLAAELPEPQTGREDFEAADAVAGTDELASSSIDLEEALHKEDESESDEDAEEGAFANGSTVV